MEPYNLRLGRNPRLSLRPDKLCLQVNAHITSQPKDLTSYVPAGSSAAGRLLGSMPASLTRRL